MAKPRHSSCCRGTGQACAFVRDNPGMQPYFQVQFKVPKPKDDVVELSFVSYKILKEEMGKSKIGLALLESCGFQDEEFTRMLYHYSFLS
ncbi:hypothetical protein N7540_013045 [Penicillium herquei]|nr:hypothetical protein N7540_013045 [Penicillium herquei]